MIKLLVVDDFEADREEITTIVASFAGELDIEIVGECDNGIAAMEAMGPLRPDIVLSDIQMPYMDGFALAEQTQSRYPDISFVFLSLYGDVEHLKGAIDLNCNGYIIKPVDPGELRACLEKQIERCTEQQRLVSEHRELRRLVRDSTPFIIDGLVRDLLAGRADPAELAEKFRYFGVGVPLANLRVCVIEIDSLGAEDVEARQIRVMNINRLAASGLATAGELPLFRLDDTHMVYFFPCGETEPRGESPFRKALEAAEAAVGAVRKGGFSVTLAISDVCAGPADVPRMYEQCLYMLRFKYSLGKSRVILPEEIPGSVTGPETDFNALQKDIRFVLNSLEEDAVTAFADNVFSGLAGQVVERQGHLNAAVAVFLQVYLEENGIQHEEVFREGDGFERYLGLETIEDSKRWLVETLGAIRGHILSRNRNKGRFTVGRIKEFIRTRPVEELTLERIATHFFYSPNYINSLFKRETGSTISDYVTTCKIRRAKEMLADPGKTVASVAVALGYSHVSYFNYVFKRHLGMTPKEYREGRASRLG